MAAEMNRTALPAARMPSMSPLRPVLGLLALSLALACEGPISPSGTVEHDDTMKSDAATPPLATGGDKGEVVGGTPQPPTTPDASSPEDDGATPAPNAGDGSMPEPDADMMEPPAGNPPSRCAEGDFLLCESFETTPVGGPADSGLWQTVGNELRVTDVRAARGQRALQVTTWSNESLNFIRTTNIVPTAGKSMWGRIFMYIETPRPGAFSHWTVVEATGTHPAGGTARVRIGGIHIPDVRNTLDFNYDIWGMRPDTFHEVGTNAMETTPEDRFICLEWMFDVDNREVRVFLDGVEDPDLHAQGAIDGIPLDFPVFDGLNIGMATYQPLGDTPWRVTLDEVAVALNRIGCDG